MTFSTRSRATVAVAAALGVFAVAACQSEEAPGADPTTAALVTSDLAAQSQAPAAPAPVGPTRRISLDDLGYDHGDPNAPVQLIEFSDFGCGYCRRFHEEIWPVLEEEYVATGKVYWKYMPMVLGIFPNATEAAQAGECAGEQGSFREMQDRLFADQSVWKRSDDPMADLTAMAEDLDLDVERWRRCIANGVRDDRIAAGTQLSQQAGVRGTPTFFVLGYAPIPGALPLELFREVLDTAHAAALRGDGPSRGPGGP
ncbi:MAG: thioredoxin domain-containing protein [Gemmatimonadetes bacterium]|nr:thioredoxin domain-containing protein [Gemmatimonadota bacterium]